LREDWPASARQTDKETRLSSANDANPLLKGGDIAGLEGVAILSVAKLLLGIVCTLLSISRDHPQRFRIAIP